ncbi:helix-turn-helix domain-containing protein [Bacillus sp. FSL K6-1284]|uniref:helix-turn-helix domain-containing protein n=1 Tax=Bacillus sp. FSL K6-1284 TaxID=2921468 RepID=UPI0030F69E28
MTNEERGVLDLREHKFAQVASSVLVDVKILDKSAQKLVYTMLSMHADNHSKQSFPSIKTLAAECFCSENTAREALRKLKEVGLIDIRERRSRESGQLSNLYVLLPIPKAFENEAGGS